MKRLVGVAAAVVMAVALVGSAVSVGPVMEAMKPVNSLLVVSIPSSGCGPMVAALSDLKWKRFPRCVKS